MKTTARGTEVVVVGIACREAKGTEASCAHWDCDVAAAAHRAVSAAACSDEAHRS